MSKLHTPVVHSWSSFKENATDFVVLTFKKMGSTCGAHLDNIGPTWVLISRKSDQLVVLILIKRGQLVVVLISRKSGRLVVLLSIKCDPIGAMRRCCHPQFSNETISFETPRQFPYQTREKNKSTNTAHHYPRPLNVIPRNKHQKPVGLARTVCDATYQEQRTLIMGPYGVIRRSNFRITPVGSLTPNVCHHISLRVSNSQQAEAPGTYIGV